MKRTEGSIQRSIQNWVSRSWPRDEKTGVTDLEMRKFSQGGARFPTGDPDWLFIPKRPRYPWMMELKSKGEKPTPKQAAIIQRWRAMGIHVYVADSVDKAKEIILAEMGETDG